MAQQWYTLLMQQWEWLFTLQYIFNFDIPLTFIFSVTAISFSIEYLSSETEMQIVIPLDNNLRGLKQIIEITSIFFFYIRRVQNAQHFLIYLTTVSRYLAADKRQRETRQCLAITGSQSALIVARDGVFDFLVQRDAVCLVRGFLAQHHGRVLKLLINRRPFFRAAKQQPAEVLAKCDLCYTSPCQNGGFCETLPDRQFSCKCAPGYHGDRCQHKIDACYGNPCRNSGTCKVLEEGRFRYLLSRQSNLDQNSSSSG